MQATVFTQSWVFLGLLSLLTQSSGQGFSGLEEGGQAGKLAPAPAGNIA